MDTARNEGDKSAVFQRTEHGSGGVFVPFISETHVSPHNTRRSQKILQNLIQRRQICRKLLCMHMVKLQDLADCLPRELLICMEAYLEFSAPVYQVRQLRKRIGEYVIVILHSLANLFIKPTHK